MTQKKVSCTSSDGPPRSYYGALKTNLNTCTKGTKLRVYRCSFHMCPIKAWFEDFKEVDGGHVLLGNNKHCKILGTGTVRIKGY